MSNDFEVLHPGRMPRSPMNLDALEKRSRKMECRCTGYSMVGANRHADTCPFRIGTEAADAIASLRARLAVPADAEVERVAKALEWELLEDHSDALLIEAATMLRSLARTCTEQAAEVARLNAASDIAKSNAERDRLREALRRFAIGHYEAIEGANSFGKCYVCDTSWTPDTAPEAHQSVAGAACLCVLPDAAT